LNGRPAYVDDIEIDRGDEVLPLEMWASPIRDETGIVESAVVVLEDITGRKQTEAELAEYRKHLEALVEKRTIELNAANSQLQLTSTIVAINQLTRR
jgi:signal transduction histidine kinase